MASDDEVLNIAEAEAARWHETLEQLRDAGEPAYDPRLRAVVAKVTENWLVTVSEFIFNDRVIISHRGDYPTSVPMLYERGWCYDKGHAAMLAALAWDPETDEEPVGFKKRVGE